MRVPSRCLLLGLWSLVLLPVGCGGAADQPAEPSGAQVGGAIESRSQELKIANVKVGKGTPTGTYFNGSLWLAYTGTDGNIHTLQRTGSNTFIDRKTSFLPNSGPSLAVYHNQLYVTWADVPSPFQRSRFIAYKSSDGIQWQAAISNTLDLPEIKYAPGMAVYFDVLIAFTTFAGSSSTVLQFNYDEGTNKWTHVENLRLETTIGPSAATLGNDLFVAAVDGNGEVRTQKYNFTQWWRLAVSKLRRTPRAGASHHRWHGDTLAAVAGQPVRQHRPESRSASTAPSMASASPAWESSGTLRTSGPTASAPTTLPSSWSTGGRTMAST